MDEFGVTPADREAAFKLVFHRQEPTGLVADWIAGERGLLSLGMAYADLVNAAYAISTARKQGETNPTREAAYALVERELRPNGYSGPRVTGIQWGNGFVYLECEERDDVDGETLMLAVDALKGGA